MNKFSAIGQGLPLAVVLILATIDFAETKGPPHETASVETAHTLRKGDALHLRCPLTSDPAPHFDWAKNGERINVGWDNVRTKEDALHIRAVEEGDTGEYVCTATNGFGTMSVSFNVCVRGNDSAGPLSADANQYCIAAAPTFLHGSQTEEYVDLQAGSSFELNCLTNTRPKPEVVWFKDSRQLEHRDANPFVYILNPVTMEQVGRYTCRIFNSMGSANMTFVVSVKEKVDEKPWFPPASLQNVTVTLGRTAVFSCLVHSGDERTRIQWLKQLTPVSDVRKLNVSTIQVGTEHFVVVQSGATFHPYGNGRYLSTLTIDDVTERDAGVYVCSAVNSHGYVTRNATLRIKPELPPPPTYLPAIIGSVVGLVGLVVIACVLQHTLCGRRGVVSKRPPSSTPASPLNIPYAAGNGGLDRKATDASCYRDAMSGSPPVGPDQSRYGGGPGRHSQLGLVQSPQQQPSMGVDYRTAVTHGMTPQQMLLQQQQQQRLLQQQDVQYRLYEEC